MLKQINWVAMVDMRVCDTQETSRCMMLVCFVESVWRVED